MYLGKYKCVDFSHIKDSLKEILSANDYRVFICESSICHNQIHIMAMNQAYEIYEKYMTGEYKKGDLQYISVKPNSLVL